MGLPDSDPLPRVGSYSGAEPVSSPFVYGTFTLSRRTFQSRSTRVFHRCVRSYNPIRRSGWFRLVRFRSPLLTESRFLSLPPGTEMFQFPGLATCTYAFSAG